MLPDPWLDEEIVSAGLRPPAFPDHTQLLNLILSAVPSASTNGIVVAGERGSGKSHLLLAIKAGLHPSLDVRTFTGKPELESTRYGALEAGAEAPVEQVAMPELHVLRALTDSLGPAEYLYTPPPARRRGRRRVEPLRRRPLVLLVDDIHFVDPASLAVLLQLLPGFGATLVATADSRRPLPEDLYHLWHDGFLEQYLLPPFTFNEAHSVCEEVLGGKVQRRASGLLAAMSGFNVGLLCLALEDARRAHLLVRHDGFWTIDARAHCTWPRVVEHIGAENALRPSEERQALELVALGEPVALDIVERRCGQKAVESLLSARDLRLLPGRPPLVRTSSWLRGEGTRLSVPRQKSTALRLAVEEPALSKETAPAMLRWMTWSLDSGLSLSDELILAAAPAADRPSTAELAVRAAAAVKDPGHLGEARLLKARALVAEGRLKAATPELQALTASELPAEVQEDAGHRLMALGLLGAVSDPGLQLGIAGLRGGVEPADPAERVIWNVRQAELLLLSGAAPAALARSSAAMSAISADPALEIFLPGVLLRHMVCLRYNLAWDELDSLVKCRWDYAVPAHLAWCMEVARGYGQLSQGLPLAARGTLEPVVAELHDAGLPPVSWLASSLLAYSEAMCGELEQAMSRVDPVPAATEDVKGKDLLHQLSALFAAAARDTSSSQRGHLFDLAEDFHKGQSPLLEAEALSLLTLNASSTAVDDLVLQRRLGELSRAVEGAGGASMSAFASALLGNDPRTLESAGRSLSTDRQFAQSAVCYSRAATGYEARMRSAASRRAMVMRGRLQAVFESADVPSPGWLPGTAGR
ncbi:ATP-binding protein [Paenarthrobacter sp. NPDC089322]|uniref:ATP-binding protein n=1 Tax=Paenarthrobacter sp. NPDC089322 TaxID=3155065 RepID=UPI00342C19EA